MNKMKKNKEAKKTIGINMPVAVAEEIEKRGKEMNIGASKYCLFVLQKWISSGQKLELRE